MASPGCSQSCNFQLASDWLWVLAGPGMGLGQSEECFQMQKSWGYCQRHRSWQRPRGKVFGPQRLGMQQRQVPPGEQQRGLRQCQPAGQCWLS